MAGEKEKLFANTTLAACNLFFPTATGGALSLDAANEKMCGRPLRPLLF